MLEIYQAKNICDRIFISLEKIVKAQNKVLRAVFRKPGYNEKTGRQTSVTALYRTKCS